MKQKDSEKLTQNNGLMDYTQRVIRLLQKFLDKNPGKRSISANIAIINNELLITVWKGWRVKKFKFPEDKYLLGSLSHYLKVT